MIHTVPCRIGYYLLLAAIAFAGSLAPTVSAAEDPRDEKIERALKNPTVLEFIETPLTDVVAYLSDLHNFKIQIDTKALEKAKVSSDSPITKNVKDVSLAKALGEILKPLELDYIIKDHTLTITTTEAAKEWRKTQAKEKK